MARGENNFELTELERNILHSLSEGMLFKEIAAAQNIDIGAVKEQVKSVYRKMQVKNRVEANSSFYKKFK